MMIPVLLDSMRRCCLMRPSKPFHKTLQIVGCFSAGLTVVNEKCLIFVYIHRHPWNLPCSHCSGHMDPFSAVHICQSA